MLTPQEVSEHAFIKATFGGYNMNAVDEFLDELTDDYTALYKENAALKAKMKVLVDKVEEYRATEDSMRSALLTAQKMATNMVTEAEERKETLLADAEMEARAKIGALHDEIMEEQKKLNAVKTATREFSERTRAVCEAHLRLLAQLPDLTPEPIGQAAGETRSDRDVTADIEALGQKIVASYGRYAEEPEKPAERSEPEKSAAPAASPVPRHPAPPKPSRSPAPKAVDDRTMTFPVMKINEPQTPPAPGEKLEPDDSPFVETTSTPIHLADLKFGRNYRAEEDD